MNTYLSTEQCSQKVPTKNYHQQQQKRKRLRKKLILLETAFASIVLIIATVSSLLCIWSFSGRNITELPSTTTIVIALGIQTLPWIIKSAIPCSQLTALSTLCILMATLSFASGVALIKKNPAKVSQTKPEASQIPTKVTILPAKKSSSDEGIVALYQQ